MITVDQLKTSGLARYLKPSVGINPKAHPKGVLTLAEAEALLRTSGKVITISDFNSKTYFFTDDHMYGYKVLPETYVPVSSYLPLVIQSRDVVPRPLTINTVAAYIEAFYSGYPSPAESVEALVSIVNEIPQLL